IDQSGLVAAFGAEIQPDAHVPQALGFDFISLVKRPIEINTTSAAVNLTHFGNVDPGFRVQIGGALSVGGIKLSGDFDLLIERDLFQVTVTGGSINLTVGSQTLLYFNTSG